jgi:hypothetical protein
LGGWYVGEVGARTPTTFVSWWGGGEIAWRDGKDTFWGDCWRWVLVVVRECWSSDLVGMDMETLVRL